MPDVFNRDELDRSCTCDRLLAWRCPVHGVKETLCDATGCDKPAVWTDPGEWGGDVYLCGEHFRP